MAVKKKVATKKKTKPAKKKAVVAKKAVKKKKQVRKTAKASRKPSVKAKVALKRKKAPKKKLTTARKVKKAVPRKKSVARKRTVETEDARKERLAALRRDLLQKRERILKEAKQEIAKYISGETRQLVDTALDDGDWAVVDISEDVSLRMLSTHRDAMRDIDEAVRKIDEGTYGICEECGEAISEKRLSILPAATLCIDCQENKERLEAISKAEEV